MENRYFDSNNEEIKEGMTVQHEDGDIEKVYKTNDDDLGFNASNENYRGFDPLFRELYPLYQFNTREYTIIDKGNGKAE